MIVSITWVKPLHVCLSDGCTTDIYNFCLIKCLFAALHRGGCCFSLDNICERYFTSNDLIGEKNKQPALVFRFEQILDSAFSGGVANASAEGTKTVDGLYNLIDRIYSIFYRGFRCICLCELHLLTISTPLVFINSP